MMAILGKFVLFLLFMITAVSFFFFSPLGAIYLDAQVQPINPNTASDLGIRGEGTLAEFITQVVNVFLVLVGIIAVVFLIIGGVQYITAAGNSQQSETAKKTIMYAIIGILVIGLSWAIVHFVITNAIQGGGGQGGGEDLP